MAMKDEAENEEEGLQAPNKSKSGGRGGLRVDALYNQGSAERERLECYLRGRYRGGGGGGRNLKI